MRSLVFLTLLPTLALAQPSTGSVSGHVYLADSQQPARYARVVLVPLPPALTSPLASAPIPQHYSSETLRDGSFGAANIPPGDYYVSVTHPGYLTPEYQFSANDLLQPTPDLRRHIVETIPTLTVAANKSTAVSVYLHRGAAISGTLRYDDGSPVPEVEIVPLRRSATGSWEEIASRPGNNSMFPNGGTDDLGHFRIQGLPAGEYTLAASRWADHQEALTVYYGDVFFEKDAKPIRLGEGEENSGADISVRLSKLHTVSGSLVNGSGQPINSGKIALITVPGNLMIASAWVPDEGTVFNMDLVPEGRYTLRVTQARDVNLRITRDDKDPNQISDMKRTVLQTYGDYEAPLEVLSDVTDLTLTIPSNPSNPSKGSPNKSLP